MWVDPFNHCRQPIFDQCHLAACKLRRPGMLTEFLLEQSDRCGSTVLKHQDPTGDAQL